MPEAEAVRTIRKKYRVSADQARGDLRTIQSQLSELIRPDGACPIHELELETLAPFSARPVRAVPHGPGDYLSLQQRLRALLQPGAPALTRGTSPAGRGELDTAEWKQVLDKTWALGIPHIVFTGGEPTLRDDLPELIAHAEANGQITGLNTNARRLV